MLDNMDISRHNYRYFYQKSIQSHDLKPLKFQRKRGSFPIPFRWRRVAIDNRTVITINTVECQ